MKNPWQTIKSETVYENPWMKVVHNDVLNPKGDPGIYGVVQFKNRAVAVIPLDENYNTWLVGQYRYTLNAYSWEVPEGGSPLNEDPVATAKRELQEETGITAGELIEVGELHLSNSITDEHGFVFVAKNLSFGKANPEDTEELMVKKLPFDTVVKMVRENEITDALSVAAILKAKLMLDAGCI